MAKLAPLFNEAQFIDGIPANGAKLFTYVAGSSTKQATYTDEAGLTPQANPIILDSRGEPAQAIWLTDGASYKFVFSAPDDTDPPTSPIRTIDNVTGINDATVALSQWVDSGITPTYISANSFSLPGDQTSAFQVNRRVKLLVTAGTVYGYISASAFAALTTVTVVLDSGVLDSGLSNVQLGLITPNNTSLPKIPNFVNTTMIENLSVTPAKLSSGAPGWDANGVFVGGTASLDLSPTGNGQYPKFGTYTTSETVGLGTSRYSNDSAPAAIYLVKSRGASIGLKTIVQNNDVVGRLIFRAADGANYINAGYIECAVDGSPAATDMPARLSFFTTPDGSATSTEKFRIANDGSFSSVIPAGSTLYPEFKCRAWVNFVGTGTPSIRSSGNVSSITDNGAGDYTINFTTAMPDSNYSLAGSAQDNNADVRGVLSPYSPAAAYPFTTTTARIRVSGNSTSFIDVNLVCANFFR